MPKILSQAIDVLASCVGWGLVLWVFHRASCSLLRTCGRGLRVARELTQGLRDAESELREHRLGRSLPCAFEISEPDIFWLEIGNFLYNT